MFYGRVDVYWPDGPIESYRLNKSTIAVGRSSGNDIVLDTTAVSRYHITLTFTDQQVLLEDLESVNGTYVDGVRLMAHKPFILRGGEEVQLGDIRLIFHPPAEMMTTGDEQDTTQRVTASQPSYQLELDGPDMAVAPGAHVQATLRIQNLSDETDHYLVEIDGLPKGWVRIDRVELAIEPGEAGQAVISFKPLRRSETQPGEHAFTVRVRSKSRPAETLDVPTVLHVLPFSGFGMALSSSRLENGNSFKLYLHNQGNAPLPLSLEGTDPAQLLRVQLPKTQLQLGPGERHTLAGTVEPRRRRLFGQDYDREFVLLARSHDQAGFLASIPGVYVEKGMLPAWTPALIVPVIALAALLLAALVLWVFNRDDNEAARPPVISQFAVASSALTVGEMAELTWQVADAETIEIVVERQGEQQRFAVEPTAQSLAVPFDQTGRYRLILEANNQGELATSSAMIEVRPMVVLDLEVLDADELARNVQHDIRVSWNVSGAREFDGQYSVWLESSERIGPLLTAPLPLTGSQDIQIVLPGDQAEWLVTLYAEGRDNVLANVTQKLPAAFPSCELTATRTVVRSGPDTIYPAIVPPLERSEAGSVSLQPLARDPSGDWLQVTIGVDDARTGWVPREDFVCTNFDPSRLVITEDFPALPPTTVPPAGDETSAPSMTPPQPTATPAASPS